MKAPWAVEFRKKTVYLIPVFLVEVWYDNIIMHVNVNPADENRHIRLFVTISWIENMKTRLGLYVLQLLNILSPVVSLLRLIFL